MSIRLVRPVEADGVRLFYRTNYDVRKGKIGGHYKGAMFIPPKNNDEKGLFRIMDPDNVMATMRLYRWFLQEYQRCKSRGDGIFSGMIQKDDLMGQCFGDWPSANKHRVGRLLRLILPYEVNFQTNRGKDGLSQMHWRWTHALDVAYGLEHVIALWLPRVIESDDGSCSTTEEFVEELEIVASQEKEEDHRLVSVILEKNLH